MTAITLGILILALSASFLFINRIIRPLSARAEAAENIDEENSAFPVYHENQFLGALLIACPGNCQCDIKELAWPDLREL
jgi:hypothetical protein